MRRILRHLGPMAPVIDVLLSWFTFIGVIWFRIIKFWDPRYTPFSKWLFLKMGMIPVVKHYEGFLSFNQQFKVVLSISYLMNSYRDQINALFPNLRKYPDVNPSSLWVRKV